MRTIGKLVLGLAVAAFFGIAATPAVATPAWQTCTNMETEIGSFENSTCTKEKEGGKYEWLEVAGTETVVGHGSLTLKDTLLGVTVGVSCTGKDGGTIGPEQFDRITSITEIKCAAGENCEKLEGIAEPRNLPWQTELFETESTVRNRITSGGTGAPGWKVTCRVPILGERTDECTSEVSTTLIENLSGNVDSIFDSKSGKTNCTVGGKESGETRGAARVEDNGGSGLRTADNNKIVPNPKILDFGEIAVNTPDIQKLKYTNTGTFPWEPERAFHLKPIEGPLEDHPFHPKEDTCRGTIEAGDSCEIEVEFKPEHKTEYEQILWTGGRKSSAPATLKGKGK